MIEMKEVSLVESVNILMAKNPCETYLIIVCFAESPQFAYGAFDGEQLIGLRTGKVTTLRANASCIELTTELVFNGCYVIPKYRGQGIAVELSKYMIARHITDTIYIEAISRNGYRVAQKLQALYKNITIKKMIVI